MRAAASATRAVRKERRRDSILEAARAVFAEKGYHRASVADVITAADIARGTFYLYFDSKRALFDEVLELFVVSLRSGIRDIDPNEPGRSPFEQVRDNVRRSVAFLLDERELTVILLNQAVGLDREFDARLQSFYDRIVDIFERALQRGIALDLVRDCDTRLAAAFFLGGFKETIYRVVVRESERPTLDEIVDQLMDTALRGILDPRAVVRGTAA